MILSEADGRLFYKLWLPLLDYVNVTHHVNKKVTNIATNMNLVPEELKKVSNYLWAHPDIIDEYLSKHSDIEEDNRSIIAGWKYSVTGNFMVERHLTKGSVLIKMDTNEVYLVKGIVSDWKELTRYMPVPVMISSTLIPWRDVIIPDGTIGMQVITFGPNITGNLEEIYLQAKKQKRIIASLPK